MAWERYQPYATQMNMLTISMYTLSSYVRNFWLNTVDIAIVEKQFKTKVLCMQAFIKFTYSVEEELFYSLNSLELFAMYVNIGLKFYNQ